MIRLTADQLYYQHRVLCLRRLLWLLVSFLSPKPKPVYFKIDGLWPNTTATDLLARDWEYLWIRLQPSFRVACQRGGAYSWKRCVVEWSIDMPLWYVVPYSTIPKYSVSLARAGCNYGHFGFRDGSTSLCYVQLTVFLPTCILAEWYVSLDLEIGIRFDHSPWPQFNTCNTTSCVVSVTQYQCKLV